VETQIESGKVPKPGRVVGVLRTRASGAFDDEYFDKLFFGLSPIRAAAVDHHRLLRRPPFTRAPVHDGPDVLPSSENSTNLVFEIAIRPPDDDVGRPAAFS